MCVCVCISLNLEEGTIPPGQINYLNFECLNIPGKELNVNKFTDQMILSQIKIIFGLIKIISIFPSS